MATGFNKDAGHKCEGPGCQAASGVKYIVKEQRSLCKGCSKKGGSTRWVKKGKHGIICEMHDKPVKLYCKDHGLAVCQICAIKDHQKPCQLENVSIVLEQKRHQIVDLRTKLRDKQLSWRAYNSRVSECRQECETHYKTVKKAVDDTHDAKMALNRKKEQEAAKQINNRADEEIRKINERREAELKKNHKDAEEHQKAVDSCRRELLDDVTSRAEATETEIARLQRSASDLMQAIDEAAERIGTLLEDDKGLIEGAQEHRLATSLTDTLGKKADEGAVEHITRIAKKVRFERQLISHACERNEVREIEIILPSARGKCLSSNRLACSTEIVSVDKI